MSAGTGTNVMDAGFLRDSVTHALVVTSTTATTPESYGAGGDAVTDDTVALQAAIATGQNIVLTRGKTYLYAGALVMATARQMLIGNGATLKRRNQYATTTATSIASGVTTSIVVADASNIRAGHYLVVEQGGTYDTAPKKVLSVVGTTVTFASALGITASGTTNVRLGFHGVWATATGCVIENVEFDGNKANWTWARWDVVSEIYLNADRCVARHNYIHDTPGEGIEQGGADDVRVMFNTILHTNGNGIHYGGSGVNKVGGRVLSNHVEDGNLASPTYADGVVSGTTNLQSTLATFTTAMVGGTVTVAGVANTVAAYVDAHNITLGTAATNGSSKTFAVDGVGHANGLVVLSNNVQDFLVHGNFLKTTTLSGVGSIDAVDNLDITISNNEIRNCGKAIDGNHGSSGSSAVNVLIAGNRIYSSGQIQVFHLNATTTWPTRWKIVNNLLVDTVINLTQAEWCTVENNSIVMNDATSTCVSLTYCRECKVVGNTIDGGNVGVYLLGAAGGTTPALGQMNAVQVAGNDITRQHTYGVQIADGGLFTGVCVEGNHVTNDSTFDAAAYMPIRVGGRADVRFNNVALAGLFRGVLVIGNAAANKALVQGNVVKALTGSALAYGINVQAGVTSVVVKDNVTDAAMSDAGTTTALSGNVVS